ncbi:tRNA (N(6)-L-threonylcarbamoyladenosine(37)-C(2))-methylthiotransferase MtaB [Campylobacter vicugnae]|uniref:tRNA (N(6)-L-threonylcarbamoyladenosine(37)-C(2))- methylthiotransferase MtaB n=1 Tax=Campylobacter vicugnae TaxID=1660076 RepID=UPI00254DD260|nr:tRNA (N(6)-L-threonylcarbamoyladenosine(37)-C(2))-methylthiotransferase MtaB [Campylobacter ovis]MDL0104893.1 tRNA (N(6)-L-threonylcarbamoyladenosine(37)-C(2))-methylthiotransferase MtaB [Campylobacter ovis]MDL0105929.1 tRNA (N(6)-L-threonylcarbamoyladenosine(37)-C(2))-methylthiotransferase MtaB [Campylobacter ovis]
MKVYFKTFGCRTNIYDTELLKSYVKNYEIVNDDNIADIIVVNSCTVTNGADSGVRNYINSMRNSGKKAILTGCGAVSKGDELFKSSAIFGVLGASNKSKIDEMLGKSEPFYELGDLNFIDKNIVSNYENHTKAFIKIQEGCDFACSYCIIPSVRGFSRSIDENIILKEAKILASNGYSEIVLTGTNIGSYGKGNNTTLGKLVANLGKINGIKRIRLGSIEPSQIDDSFREILSEPWLERHLHIALQHTSQEMLTIMNRRNRALRDLDLFCELSSMGFALGTDFIVAHPGESKKIWSEAVENFIKFPLTHIHAFIFSPRNGTKSASMSIDVSPQIAKERLKTLQNIVSQNNIKFRQNNAHKPLEVLVEKSCGDDIYEGWDQYYNKIKIKSSKNISKEWINITNYDIMQEFNYAQI